MQSPTVIFCSTPKTAGTTLTRSILMREYPGDQALILDGRDVATDLEAFRGWPDELKRSRRLISGHLGYGLHRHIPGPVAYITLLRDPVERASSHYCHILSDPCHYAYRCGFREDTTFLQYLELEGISHETHDQQTSVLSGIDPGQMPPDEMLAIAKQNAAERFAVVGLTERFDASVVLMRRKLGWRHQPLYDWYMVNPRRSQSPALTPEERQAAAEANRLDMELYRFAAAHFENQIRREGPGFVVDLAWFRVRNLWYQRVEGRRNPELRGRNLDELLGRVPPAAS